MPPLSLMCVLAHPDDEAMGMGAALARYAAEGVSTYLVTATRGERGWNGDPQDDPGPGELGRLREAELRASAEALGVREVVLLDYIDGDLDQADPAQAIAQIAGHLRRIRPQVVVTFAPDGVYGHPDHIAISQFTSAAVVAAADPAFYAAGTQTPHQVSKLYHLASRQSLLEQYQAVFGDLIMGVDGVERQAPPWPDWAVTTRVDAEAYWAVIWRAVACHRTQIAGNERLAALTPDEHRAIWGVRTFYRAYSLVNGGRRLETDMFEGLR